MIQWILTILIVLLAFVYAGYRIKKRFFTKEEAKDPDCQGCTSDCKSCPLSAEDLVKKWDKVNQSSDRM